MRSRSCLTVLVAACALAAGCSNFLPADEGGTLHAMNDPPRWVAYDGPAIPPARLFPSVTPSPAGAVVFGGRGLAGLLADGWRWDGARWHPLPLDGAPVGRASHAAAWTGDGLCVWGGEGRGASLGDGACWDASTDRWRAMETEGAPSPRGAMASAFTGREWIVWGGRDADGNDLADGARYDPQRRRWSALPDGGPRARHRGVAAVSPEGSRVLIWGGAGEALALGAEDAAILDIQSNRWMPVDLQGAPPASSGPVAVEVPAGLVAFGGDVAAVFEWRTLRWRALDRCPLPSRWGVTAVATPAGVLIWGGHDEAGVRSDGATLDVTTGRWLPTPPLAASDARADAVGLVDARQVLLLWGTGVEGLRTDVLTLR